MAARSIGSLTLSFGLVAIPVKLYSATQSGSSISFNLLHKDCGSRLKQQYICQKHGTLVERDATRRMLVAAIKHDLEPQALVDEHGLEALRVWSGALEAADVNDVDLLQELLYGIDALVCVHLWRETGLPLTPPEPRPASDV